MDTFNTCFDEEDLLCPASQRITSKAWMYETPYPILPPVDALPLANETALPTAPSDYLTYQPLDPEEALQYEATYQAAKELVEEELACGAHTEGHQFRLRAYTMALNCMAPPGVLDPLK
jgi:hypothetical protein